MLTIFEILTLIRRSTLDERERSILYAVASYANAEGKCWPSTDTLIADTAIPRPSFFRSMASLRQKGLISREVDLGGRRGRDGRGMLKLTVYQAHWDRLFELQRPTAGPSRKPSISRPEEPSLFGPSMSQGETWSDQVSGGDLVQVSGGDPPSLPGRPGQTRSPGETQNSHKELTTPPTPSEPDAEPTAEVCAVLIRDFYQRWFGPEFDPPSFNAAELALARQAIAACRGVLAAVAAQADVVERLRKSFRGCRRFVGAQTEWKLRIAAAANLKRDDVRRQRAREEHAAAAAASQQHSAQAIVDAALPRWRALSESERQRFLSRYPPAVGGREFFAVLDFADESSVEASCHAS